MYIYKYGSMDPCKFIDLLYISGFVIDCRSRRRKLMYPLSSVKYVRLFLSLWSPDIRTIFRTVVSQALMSHKINIQAGKHF